VRSAYRDRVKEVHPDTEDGDAETFQEVNDAYERLRED
jgi:curved DNA-binding protein CbpA